MGFFRKLKKKLLRGAALYGKVGGLFGAPGAGIVGRVSSGLEARAHSGGHQTRAMARMQGIGHNRLHVMMMARNRSLTPRGFYGYSTRRRRRY